MDCNISVYSPNSREKWITICFLMTRHRRVSDTHTHRHTDTDTLAHTHRHTEREREREKERKRERVGGEGKVGGYEKLCRRVRGIIYQRMRVGWMSTAINTTFHVNSIWSFPSSWQTLKFKRWPIRFCRTRRYSYVFVCSIHLQRYAAVWLYFINCTESCCEVWSSLATLLDWIGL